MTDRSTGPAVPEPAAAPEPAARKIAVARPPPRRTGGRVPDRVGRDCALAAIAGATFAGLDEGAGVAVAGRVLVLVAVVAAFVSGDMLFGRLETWLYVDLLMVTVWLLVWVWPNLLAVVGSLLLLGVVALVRGPLVGWSMGRSLRKLTSRADQSLAGLNDEPLHVFLATELRTGHHACFAPGFVYCYDLVLGAKPSLPVRVAVLCRRRPTFPGRSRPAGRGPHASGDEDLMGCARTSNSTTSASSRGDHGGRHASPPAAHVRRELAAQL